MLKKKLSMGGIALVAALALGFGTAVPAQAVPLSTPEVKNPSWAYQSEGTKARAVSAQVTFKGDAPNDDLYYVPYRMTDCSGAKMLGYSRNKGVKSNNIFRPYFDMNEYKVVPGKANKATISVYQYTTPGKYKFKVPVTERRYNWTSWAYENTTRTSATKYFTVKSTPKNSKNRTSFSGYSQRNGSFRMTVSAPDYQSGSAAVVYYKAKGAKSYKKVAASRLAAVNYSSRKTITVPASKKIRTGGHVKVKIGSVTYAPGYTTSSAKIVRY